MPMLRDQTDLASITRQFEQWRDTSTLPNTPSTTPVLQVGYGCKLKEFFRVPLTQAGPNVRILLEKGLQGRVARITGDKVYVVFMEIFYKGRGIEAWVPAAHLQPGTVPWGQWKIDQDIGVQNVRNMPPIPRFAGDDGQLAKAIATFLKVLFADHPTLDTETIKALGMNGENIPKITQVLVAGVQKAGLLDILNKSDFNIDLMRKHSRLLTKKDVKLNLIYFRDYTEADSTIHQYIGKTANVPRRIQAYDKEDNAPTPENRHAKLRRKATHRTMHALCILDEKTYDNIHFIAEQVFVSLFETYSPELIAAARGKSIGSIRGKISATDDDLNTAGEWATDIESFIRFDAIAKRAAALSNWPGAIKRSSSKPKYGVKYGVNWNSPLTETANQGFVPWIRTTASIVDPDTYDVIKIANFRRAKPKKTHWMAHAMGVPYIDVLRLPRNLTTTWTLPKNSSADGVNAPKEGTPMFHTIEVRLDWQTHKRAMAGLPAIGPFGDWVRATSIAHRIEWDNGKGDYHRRYYRFPFNSPAHSEVPGSSRSYARAMSFIHYLFGEVRTNNVSYGGKEWVINWGAAPVKEAVFDCLTQKITFTEPQRNTNPPVSSLRKAPATIEAEMNDPKYHLTVKSWGNKGYGGCDTCKFSSRADIRCIRVKGMDVCDFCYTQFGRTSCTWSVNPTVPGTKSSQFFSQPGQEINLVRRKALFGVAEIVDNTTTFSSEIEELTDDVEYPQTGAPEFDDGYDSP